MDEAAFGPFDAFRAEGVGCTAVADWLVHVASGGILISIEWRSVHGDHPVPATRHEDRQTGTDLLPCGARSEVWKVVSRGGVALLVAQDESVVVPWWELEVQSTRGSVAAAVGGEQRQDV